MHVFHLLYLQPPIASFTMTKTDINVSLMQDQNKFYVYILVLNGQFVYIGRTSNLYSRMITHKNKKDFTDILLLEYNTYKETYKVETTLIKIYKPIHNIKCVNAA
jgi:hypothetical protein